MRIPSLRLARPFIFSVLVVAAFASKILHLFQHASSIPFYRFVLYFPTFFFQDCGLVVIARLLLYGATGVTAIIGILAGGTLAVLCLGAASAQLGFYYVTGGEIRWETTKTMAGDPAAIRLLMSGIFPVAVASGSLLVVAALGTPVLYNKVGFWLQALQKHLSPDNLDVLLLPIVNTTKFSRPPLRPHQRTMRRLWPLGLLVAVVALIALRLTRPPKPYDHMSATLPIVLTKALSVKRKGCTVGHASPAAAELSFPFPDLIAEALWEPPRGNFKGWAPGPANFLSTQYTESRPEWLPDNYSSLAGFDRWTSRETDPGDDSNSTGKTEPSRKKQCSSDGTATQYNPVADPLRITNLDQDPYESLQKAFRESNIMISHIVLVTMESARKDLFPLKQGSHLHDVILKSHGKAATRDTIEEHLSQMTRVAEQLTGELFKLNSSVEQSLSRRRPLPPGLWQDPAGPEMGGINVVGALTGSSYSFKSLLGSHCGVGPLTEDFLDEELEADIYQPCIPQILKLFNAAKEPEPVLADDSSDYSEEHGHDDDDSSNHRSHVLGRQWASAFTQSITDQYDDQDQLNERMSFDSVVASGTLEDESAAHYPPTEPELNYFGYSEAQVKPYIRDLIEDAVTNDKRLFLSHMTSTTHHPWTTPDDFEDIDYIGPKGSTDEDLNNFLNTIRYDDIWLGELLQLLEEENIANETLVVVVGDHGQAFEDDSGPLSGTYENGHISNFRVPLIFRHPHLPRIQVDANATPMSIIPTILDLLVHTKSLDQADTTAAQDLIHEYEAQSLIRPYKPSHNGRQAWNFGIVNPGSTLLAVSSAAFPYRVVIPLSDDFQYTFTNLANDPNELHPLENWDVNDLVGPVERVHGAEAAKWLVEADAIGRWWAAETRRFWHFHS